MPQGDQDIVLFTGGTDGYGDAVSRDRDSYAWAANMDSRFGKLVPASAVAQVKASATFAPIRCLFEWENSSADPLLIWTGSDTSGNATIYQWENTTLTESDNAILYFTSGVLYRYDEDATADPDEEIAYFCNGYGNTAIKRRKKDGTVDGGSATTYDAKADLLAVVGADLYRGYHDYKIGKLTDRTDPGDDSNYPTDAASVPAGRPSYPINSILSLGASPFVITGIGVFKYNPAPSSAVFDSVLDFKAPHPDHGKVASSDGRGRLYVATAYGQLIVLTFGYANTYQPIKDTFFDRNTAQGDISAITSDLDGVWVAFEPGTTQLTQDGMGLYVQEDDGGVYTNHTTAVTSRQWNSEGDISALTTGDYLYIGCTEPFMGARIELAGKRASTTAASALTVEYSSGASSWTSATIMDGTMTFVQDGFISMHNSFQHPFEHSTPWTSFAVNSVTRYWMRININSTLTGVTLREVSVVPYRPSIDPDRNNQTTATRMSGYKQANALPTVVHGTWKGERLVWHEMFTIWSSKIEQMLVGRVNDGVTDSDNALYMLTADGLYAAPVGQEGDSIKAAWPNTGFTDTLAAGTNDHLFATSVHEFDYPTQVGRIDLKGKGLQEDDGFFVYTRMEPQPEWKRYGPFEHFPVQIGGVGKGTSLQVAIAYRDASRDAFPPQVDKISIPANSWYSDDEGMGEAEEAIQSPQKY